MLSKLPEAYIKNLLFFCFLSLVFLLEGSGMRNGREVSLWIIIFSPLLFLPVLKRISYKDIPKNLRIALMAFLIASIIPVFLSTDRMNSTKYLLFYGAVVGIFFVSYAKRGEIKKILPSFIIFFSSLFCLYSLVLQYIVVWPFLKISSGYQVVFSKFGSHNHLGDFLLLPVLICLYRLYTTKEKKYVFLVFFFLIFLLFSYSRSSYLALFITSLIMLFRTFKKKNHTFLKRYFFFATGLSLILIFFFFITVREAQQIGFFKDANQILVADAQLKEKSFRGQRLEFVREALLSFQEKPLFGVGPGNFLKASDKYTSIPIVTDSAHNIFLDVLVENGLPAFICFCVILILMIKNAQKNSLFFFLFLGLFINFQTDYTHRIYFFLLLFFIIMGLSMPESRGKSTEWVGEVIG